MNIDDYITIVRVICLLVTVACQVSIAYSLWLFHKRGVAAFDMPNLILMFAVTAVVLSMSAALLLIQVIW